jgi:hypothetical protein
MSISTDEYVSRNFSGRAVAVGEMCGAGVAVRRDPARLAGGGG